MTQPPEPMCIYQHDPKHLWQRADGGYVCGICHPNPADLILMHAQRTAIDG